MYNEDVRIATAITKVLVNVAILVMAIFTNGIMRTEVPIPKQRVTVTVNQSTQSVPFKEEMTARHWWFGLMQGEQVNVDLSIDKYIRPGDELKEITVWTRRTVVDILLSLVTLGVYVPVTVTIEGEIVRKY